MKIPLIVEPEDSEYISRNSGYLEKEANRTQWRNHNHR